jgi:hypothetical protein
MKSSESELHCLTKVDNSLETVDISGIMVDKLPEMVNKLVKTVDKRLIQLPPPLVYGRTNAKRKKTSIFYYQLNRNF